MTSGRLSAYCLAGLAILGVVSARGPAWYGSEGYQPTRGKTPLDTLRVKSAARARAGGNARWAFGAVIPGYLSSRGLPPVPGTLILSDSGLIFHQANGHRWQASAVSLAYMDKSNGRPAYIFRFDAGVFETDTPGPLLDLATHPDWLDNVRSGQWSTEQPLVDRGDTAAVWSTARKMAASSYADSLYTLFGRPRAAVGLVGPHGRRAGRLGEYVAGRDSLALDPGRMSSEEQLRHVMAHELGHRWQARAPGQVATLWPSVPPIRDPKRYGYNDVPEQQAEALAFAINFLQTTAPGTQSPEEARVLLDHYELLVPGTRTMVRYLSLQPLYRKHPLRALLTSQQPT